MGPRHRRRARCRREVDSQILAGRRAASLNTKTCMNGDVHMICHADNINVAVEDLVRPILAGEHCLVVTAYQDFLTALALVLAYRPDIANEPPGTVRIVFGADMASTDTFAAGRQLSEDAKRHWLGRRGLSLHNQGELRAVLARDAVESGALDLRVFDAEHAREETGRKPAGILHAKIFSGPAEIAAGSANFSAWRLETQRGILRRVQGGHRSVPDPSPRGGDVLAMRCPLERRSLGDTRPASEVCHAAGSDLPGFL